jgi:GT2 family glycosyltransferase
MVDIDIVIPTFGRPETVNTTLRMLLDQDTFPRRVIVVNQTPGIDAAAPEVRQALADADLELIWINRSLPSLCGARNDALRNSLAEICLFLDDDIIPPKDLVRKHWARHHDGVGWVAVGGQVWHRLPDVTIDQLSLDDPKLGTIPALINTEQVSGGFLFGGHFSIHREVALSVGGWDESFIGSANYEEVDLINRLRIKGFPFVWDPSIFLLHLRLPSGGCRIPGSTLFPEWTKCANFFLYKHRYPKDLPWKEVLIMALRAGPLRRENVVKPWRWPNAWASFLKGWWLGREKALNPIYPLLAMKTNAEQIACKRPQ